jgi:hypothetical protein
MSDAWDGLAAAERLLERAGRLSIPDLGRLIAAWTAGDEWRRVRARHAVRRAARDGGRSADLQLVEEDVDRWSESLRRGDIRTAGLGQPRHWDEDIARTRAKPAVLDAAAALLVRDLIDRADFDVLFDAWGQVIVGKSGR